MDSKHRSVMLHVRMYEHKDYSHGLHGLLLSDKGVKNGHAPRGGRGDGFTTSHSLELVTLVLPN